jgi:sugar-phosphatase
MHTIEIVAPVMDAADAARRFNAGLAADSDLTGIVAFEGAAGLVGHLPTNRWAIATSAPRNVAAVRLAYVGLPLPEVFVTIDDVATGKPAPDPYLLAAQRLGYEPTRCLVVEDAPAGIEAAIAAGATVLGVATTHRAADLAGAHAIVDRLTDIEVVTHVESLHVEWTDAPG